MQRIIIIGEGQTEQSFCKDILQPHFSKRSIFLQNPVIKKNNGGIVNWEALKHQIGLLFIDVEAFDNIFEKNEFADYEYLIETFENNPNPEMINDSSETAPSKRLSKIIRGYSKVTAGSLLAQEIGIGKIRSKCPRFNEWITKLENINKEAN